MRFLLLMLTILFITSCSDTNIQSKLPNQEFQVYWMQSGKAELSRYKLQQARYGQINNGHVVMVFVTEDFDTKKQVKAEAQTSQYATTVLKLNRIKRFNTGIYDYSLMTSVFAPVDTGRYPNVLKLTTSVQDWCGHVWMQLNLRQNNFSIQSLSYFQKESDVKQEIPIVKLEDSVWATIRRDPTSLPLGNIKMIPSSEYTRLLHKKFRDYNAITTLNNYNGRDFKLINSKKNDLIQYTISYPRLDRELKIIYEKKFPHRIAGWQEAYVEGWGDRKRKLVTTAKLTHLLRSPYWSKNKIEDEFLRKKLGLD